MTELAENWLSLAKRGDNDTFTQLYEHYHSRVFRLAMKYCKNRMDAEDVVQEVFISVFKRIKDFREESSFDTWLFRVTVNASLMKLRSNRKKECVNFEDNATQMNKDFSTGQLAELGDWERLAKGCQLPSEQLYWNELWDKLKQAGDEMGQARWQAFWLSAIQGLSEEEAAEKLGIGLNALKSRVHRSRKYLKKRMRPYLNLN